MSPYYNPYLGFYYNPYAAYLYGATNIVQLCLYDQAKEAFKRSVTPHERAKGDKAMQRLAEPYSSFTIR
jgi:hypothetical protein